MPTGARLTLSMHGDGDHDLAGASPRPTPTTTGDDEMATIATHNGTQLVETDGYYYLADDLGTPISHGWRDREDAEAALYSKSEADWPAHDVELDERGYPV